jgi:hypothetical protein
MDQMENLLSKPESSNSKDLHQKATERNPDQKEDQRKNLGQ